MKKIVSQLIKSESGYALFTFALILLVLGSFLLSPLLSLVVTGLKGGQAIERKMGELYAADAGFEDALWKLRNDPPDNYPCSDNLVINHKDVRYHIEEVGIAYKITSTAVTDSRSQTTVESYVMHPFSIFDFSAVALDGDLTIEGNAELQSYPELEQADIYANGNIYLEGAVQVHGDATASGTVNYNKNKIPPQITGNVTQNAPILQFKPIDTSEYLDEANAGTDYPGDLVLNNDCNLGPAHIHGDLSITSSAKVTLTGTVWVDGMITTDGTSHIEGGGTLVAVGDIELSGGGVLEPENIPVIISSTGNIRTAGAQTISVVLYCPNGTVSITGNAGIFGSVVGKSIVIGTSSTLGYALELKARDTQKGQFIIVSWEVT